MELDNEKKVTDYLEFALKIKNQKDFVFLLQQKELRLLFQHLRHMIKVNQEFLFDLNIELALAQVNLQMLHLDSFLLLKINMELSLIINIISS